ATQLAGQGATGTVMIDDSFTYDQVVDLPAIADLALRAGDQQRPLVRLPASGTASPTAWVLTGVAGTAGAPDASLVLDGLFISGGDVVLRGAFDTVTLSCCTLDPGTWSSVATVVDWATSADGRKLAATQLRVQATVRRLVIDRSITGPIVVGDDG